MNIRLNLYVDYFLIAANSSLITDHTDLVLDTVSDLGLHVNVYKSETTPTKVIDYLGYTIDNRSEFSVIKVSKERIIRLKKQIRIVLKKGTVPVRVLAETAGLCISTAFVVKPGKLFLRHTYRLISSRRSWDDYITVSENCVQELEWWLSSVDSFNYREVRPELIDLQLEVDASSSCWGAVLNGLEAKGDWNSRLSSQSSNHNGTGHSHGIRDVQGPSHRSYCRSFERQHNSRSFTSGTKGVLSQSFQKLQQQFGH